ncbi:MAG TPA: hypothetical protein VL049_03045, partial [Candidatus Dormibacteraeota bacterium]|nr:hypothetical protein [Candidatus Dormibacteraeota bacterium]
MVETSGQRALAIFLLTVAGERDERDPAQARLAADASGELVPVHTRQADIDEHDIGPGDAGGRQRGGAVAGHADPQAERLEQHHQALGRLDVVLDDQHAGIRRPRRLDRYRRRRLDTQPRRQPDDELGAPPDPLAASLDPAAVHLDDLLHQREADAQPAAGAIEGLVGLDEQIEHPRQQVGANADSGIAHA